MTRYSVTGVLIAAILFVFAPLVHGTQPYGDPSYGNRGPALLTVSGKIRAGNRGASDSFMDSLFAFHDITFDRAYSFDQQALEALPQHTATVRASDWPATHTFEGPLLSDVLKAAGAIGDATARFHALDGYGAELDMKTVMNYPLILALKADGNYLGLGGRGPLWLVFPIHDFPELARESDAGWSWATFHIEVE